MPKVDRKGQAEVLSQEQLQELWAELDHPHKLIAQLAYYTGSRIGEVVALRAEDVVGGKIVIRQSKTESTKTVDIVTPLADAISQVNLPGSGYLFPASPLTRAERKVYRIQRHKDSAGHVTGWEFRVVGKKPPRPHISTQAVDKAIRRACEYIGLEGVSTHSFRRSLATHLYDAGIPLRTIMAVTGHQSLASLTRYINLDEKQAGDALRRFFG
jgi:integrase/recombinase XerD